MIVQTRAPFRDVSYSRSAPGRRLRQVAEQSEDIFLIVSTIHASDLGANDRRARPTSMSPAGACITNISGVLLRAICFEGPQPRPAARGSRPPPAWAVRHPPIRLPLSLHPAAAFRQKLPWRRQDGARPAFLHMAIDIVR